MDYKFWIPLLVNVVGLFLMYRQMQLHAQAFPQANRNLGPWPVLAPYWPMLVMGIVMVGAWLPYFFRPSSDGGTSPIAQPILVGWGTPGPVCGATLNATPLMAYHDKYNVAVACGLNDPTRDKFEDPRITISSTFTIRPGNIDIKYFTQQRNGRSNKKDERRNTEAYTARSETADGSYSGVCVV